MAVVTEWGEARFHAWLARRSPARPSISLDQGRIYIFPSRIGLGFLALLLLLLVMAINYQNNLVFGLCFTLFSLFLVCIFHTFANLAGLVLRAGSAEPVFAGEIAHFHLHLASASRGRYALSVGFNGEDMQQLDLEEAQTLTTLRLPWPAVERGLMRPGRLRVRSDFPLGLLRCWSLPALDWRCLVYPEPKMLRPLQSALASDEGEEVDRRRDSDEFSGFQRYQQGESPRRIYWKAYAKGQDLLSKHYEQTVSRELILDWASLAGLGTEDRLSTLCAWALDCDTHGLSFALQLPGEFIDSGVGAEHLARVLAALALFEPGSGAHG